MKKQFRNIFALMSAVTIVMTSCNNTTKNDDTKAIAEEHNDAKYNSSDTENDADFLVAAAEINLEEIKLGQLAQNTSTSTEVKNLGKMMETAHTKSLNDLKELAAKKNITIPTTLTEKGEDAYKKLSDKSVNNFDKTYCDMMVDGHKDAISKFEKAAVECKDGDIKSWASSMLGGLRTHLDHALNCQKEFSKV
jgi:putative membrane protein